MVEFNIRENSVIRWPSENQSISRKELKYSLSIQHDTENKYSSQNAPRSGEEKGMT